MTFEKLSRFTEIVLFSVGESVVSVGLLLKVVLFFGGLLLFGSLMRRVIVPRLLRRTKLDEGVRFALARISTYAIWVVGALIGLPMLGVEMQSLVIALGAVGVGLGFGLQNIADNFVSGLILLFERPVKVGDRVQVGELQGAVIDVGARATMLRTNENVAILVPNSEFVSQRVTNLSYETNPVRFRVKVGVSYSSDVHDVRDALLKVANTRTDVLPDPAPEVLFLGFGDSSLDFDLRVATHQRLHTPDSFRSEVYFDIWDEFKARGIQIPFPQRDLHLKSVAPGIRLAADG